VDSIKKREEGKPTEGSFQRGYGSEAIPTLFFPIEYKDLGKKAPEKGGKDSKAHSQRIVLVANEIGRQLSLRDSYHWNIFEDKKSSESFKEKGKDPIKIG